MHSRKPPALSSTMIHGDIVNIRDATLNMSIHQVNETVNRDRGECQIYQVHLQLTHSFGVKCSTCFVPIVHSPPLWTPACDMTLHAVPKLLEEISFRDWTIGSITITSSLSSIFWLFGGAGAGKSALAQTLAEKFKTNEDLAASFFFFKADVNRN